MDRLPAPPSPFPVAPIVKVLPRGFLLARIYRRGGPHPAAWNQLRYFGPLATARFDHHLPPARRQARGILYAAPTLITCLAEVFQDTGEIDLRGDEPAVCVFALRRNLVLLDLRGLWPTRAGGSMAINAGPRSDARRWSQAIHGQYATIDGLWYGSSMNRNEPAVALYERAASALPRRPASDRPLVDPALRADVRRCALRLGYAVM